MSGVSGSRPAARHVLLGVFVLGVVVYIVAPMAIVVVNSFNSVAYQQFPPPGWSGRWYENLAEQDSFRSAAAYSLLLGVVSSAVALLVGTMAAYALTRRRVAGRALWQAALLSPIVVPKIVLGVGLFIFFARIGAYGSFAALALAHALISLPFVVALLTAALLGTDPSLEEAARDLGASAVGAFARVVLPRVWVPMVVAGLFAFITSFDQLESTIFLTRPGSTTLPIEMYDYTLKYQDPTVAALSTLVIALGVVIVAVVGLLLRRGEAIGALRRVQRSLVTSGAEGGPEVRPKVRTGETSGVGTVQQL
ncbi:ABC transporter permease [Pseudonocardia acaciae]|uniref:ABC transporter permease n=1 Tax=Pseudonocardia acaciae TaxID=551276 RepID=UPI00068432A1|nr:ABC transporter permease [Pseudonocardia acaciae]